MKSILITSIFLATSICQALNLSISYDRMALKELVGRSDFIFRVKVDEIIGDLVDDVCADCKAVLSIQEKLKGDYIKRNIVVDFSEVSICPPSASYRKDEELLVFLFFYEGTDSYRTVAGLDGIEYIHQESTYLVYKNAIKELLNIFKIENSFERNENIVNWIIDFYGHFYDDDLYKLLTGNKQDLVNSNLVINEIQKKKLRKMIMNKEFLSHYDCKISKVLIKPGNTIFLNKLVTLSKGLSGEELWSISHLLEEISRLSGETDLMKISERINKISQLDDDYIEQIEPLVERFLSKI